LGLAADRPIFIGLGAAILAACGLTPSYFFFALLYHLALAETLATESASW